MKIGKWIALLVAASGTAAGAQTTMYGNAGGWAVTQSDGKQCWMVTGTASSVFALSLDRQGQYGIIFSIIRSGVTPPQLPIAINAMDVPFSSDKLRITKAFTNVVTRRGVEHIYQAKLTAAEFAAIRGRRFVTFTELPTRGGGYSGISVAHHPEYDDSADQMWRKCVSDLR